MGDPPADKSRAPIGDSAVQTWTNIIMAAATVAIAIFTWLTYVVVNSGSQDTQKLITAAQTQAAAADKISSAADRFTTSAADIEQQSEIAVKDFQQAATQSIAAAKQGNSNTLTTIRNSQDAFHDDQRAWVAEVGITMDAPETGKPTHGYVTWMNSGKTFAKEVKPLVHFVSLSQMFTTEQALIKMVPSNTTENASIGVLSPNSQYKTTLQGQGPITEVEKDGIANSWYTYVWGELTYSDIFKRPHSTMFCSWRRGPAMEFIQCPFHNDAD